MRIHDLQSMLVAQTVMLMTAASLAGQTITVKQQETKTKKKKEGFKGFVKKLNPVRLLMKLFKKDKSDSLEDDQEIEQA